MRACVVSFLLVFAAIANAQDPAHWKLVTSWGTKGEPFFINPAYGFGRGWTDSTHDYSALYRTTDSGKTWHKPPYFPHLTGGSINGLTFDSPSHGYLICAADKQDSSGLFETADSGKTWVHLYSGLLASPIYAVHGKIFDGDLGTSTDNGKTWSSYPSFTNAIAGNFDSVVVADNSVSRNYYSTDLGKTWGSGSAQDVTFGSFYSIPHTRIVFGSNLPGSGGGGPIGTVLISGNSGASWSPSLYDHLSPEGFASLQGGGCVVYFSNIDSTGNIGLPFYQLKRTTDLGTSWQTINVPPYTNYFVTGHGAVIYLVVNGLLYRSTDGGDGTLSDDILPLIAMNGAATNPIAGSVGKQVNIPIVFQYGGCEPLLLDSIEIAGIKKTVFNRYISSSRPDTATASFIPTCPGIYNSLLTAHIVRDNFSSVEKSIWQQVIVPGDSGSIAARSPKLLTFPPQQLCKATDAVDSVFIASTGCRAQRIDSIRIIQSPQNAAFRAPSGSFTALPGLPSAFPVTFKAKRIGQASAQIVFYHGGGNDTVSLIGTGVADPHPLRAVSTTLVAGRTDSSDATINITSDACRVIILDSAMLPAGAVLPHASNDRPQLPLAFGSGETWPLTVRFAPSAVLPPSIPLRLYFRFMDTPDTIAFDTIVSISVQSNAVAAKDEDMSMDLYPDPSNRVLNIQNTTEINRYEILSLLGSTVLHGEPLATTFAIETSSLAEGTYILRVGTNDRIISRRFIVRH